ncbi:PQQ-dependent sugar dehydrogenase [Pseudoduganella aquatica]|uniref:PQQ-dependent sugar dehydrogenase n=1 Tax=Pseudoduganella aquatica TaxID=2660641 RepID=UPI001E4035D0|nr:PQQ-dependent sugar dehydrogenase [Pseudoduganella aquatica]
MRSSAMKLLVLSCALAGLAACGGGSGGMSVTAPPAALQLALQPVASGLSQPLYLTAPAGDSRLFIVERPGRIRVFANGALLATPFLDISSQTTSAGERGLLSMAFHPQYAQNGSFFIYYTDSNGDIAVDRMKVSDTNANLADPATAGRVITIPHREFSNHNGGQLAFGADGYLYIGTGDGGGAGDPLRNGQNLNSLLGKILRLDVGIVVPGQTYGIPSGNPYAGQAGRRGEIWAAGLRNPWRFSFDRGDGLLYIADVGQDQREEVDVAPATQAGLNYGWNIMEGTACYNAASCNQAGLTLPVFEYQHGANDVNGCSITGGYVYRGAAIPELAGTYFYSDYCKGYLKSFAYRNGAVSGAQEWAVDNPGNVLSFGQDAQGELYLLAGSGQVFRIVRR